MRLIGKILYTSTVGVLVYRKFRRKEKNANAEK